MHTLHTFNWQQTLQEWYSRPPQTGHRPVIGITGNLGDRGCELAEGYFSSIEAAGAIPLIIPPSDTPETLSDTLERIDALLLSGGADLNPLYMGQDPLPGLHNVNARRDKGELLLIRMACNRQMPILGICRGCQMLAAALDGDIYQDLASCHPHPGNLLKHSQEQDRSVASHRVTVKPGTLLDRLLPGGTLAVNSFHHQAVSHTGPYLTASAYSADGVIEAIEGSNMKPILGVQWHPEAFLTGGDRSMMPLFDWLAGEARAYRAAHRLHDRILTLDSHCDTPMFFGQDVDLGRRDRHLLVDACKMEEGRLDAVVMVAYLKQEERDEASLRAATQKACHILDQIEERIAKLPKTMALARTADDLYRLKAQNRKAVMLGIENGYAIGRNLKHIKDFRQRGVIYMTLCHNGDNDLCDSARGHSEHGGLSSLGRQAITEMNRCGMMVDLSHGAETSFYQALEASSVPIICSHSSARALCNHPRNLDDDQLRALAAAGGVVQATFYNGFLREEGQATLHDVVAHINHMVTIAGINHVGIGSDFDGDGGVPGLASAAELINLTRSLQAEGYSPDDLRLLWGENFLRVMRTAQQAASVT